MPVILLTSIGQHSGMNGWLVPADWNNNDNTIECISGGAGGCGTNDTGGCAVGGAAGGYAKVSNYRATPGARIPYAVASGSPGSFGQGFGPPRPTFDSTWFGSNPTTGNQGWPLVTNGSSSASAAWGPMTGPTAGSMTTAQGEVKFRGGNVGTAGVGVSPTHTSGTGGGGAAGPGGQGGDSPDAAPGEFGVGGASGGGTYSGAGGAAVYAGAGAGQGGDGGLYGGGGGGFIGASGRGGNGAQGVIIITYTSFVPPPPPAEEWGEILA